MKGHSYLDPLLWNTGSVFTDFNNIQSGQWSFVHEKMCFLCLSFLKNYDSIEWVNGIKRANCFCVAKIVLVSISIFVLKQTKTHVLKILVFVLLIVCALHSNGKYAQFFCKQV